MLTKSQATRIADAVAETKDALAREMRYLPKHQDARRIAFCEAHIAKLTAALETGNPPPFRTEIA